jgi:iron complex outermembrane receptor protein
MRHRLRRLSGRRLLRLATLAMLVLGLQSGTAQPTPARLQFDIPGGPLADVLLQIGRAAGVLVSFSPELVRQAQAPAIRGAYTALEAVALATRSTGLAAEVTPAGAVTVLAAAPAGRSAVAAAGIAAPAPPPPSAAPAPVANPAAALPRVEVLGTNRPREEGLKALRGNSATRTDALLVDLPQSVSVLTGDALDLQGGATSIEALRYVSGVSSRLDINGGQGVVPSLLVRGLPALYALSGMGTMRSSLPVDNVFIDRIEVPKGPSGVITGVGSYGGRGGVVNLVRKEAGVEPRGELVQSGSSQDRGTARVEADLAGQASQEIAWRVVAYGAATGPSDGGYDRRGGAGLLTSTRYRSGDVTATMTMQADRRRLTPAPAARGGVLQPDGTLSPIEPGQAPPVDTGDRLLAGAADAELGLEWRFMPRWRAQLKTRVEGADNDVRQLQIAPVLRRITWWNAALQAGLAGDVVTGPVRHQLLLGLDLSHWRMRLVDADLETGGAAGLGRVDVRDVKRELLVQDQLRLGPLRARLAVQASRVPIYEGGVQRAEQEALNWDAGFLLRLTHEASVYAGSQLSTETDIIRTIGPAIFSDGGDPTRTRQAQAGLKLDLLDDRLALTLEAFATQQLNAPTIVFTAGGPPVNPFVIMPRRRIQGLELELSGRPSAAWELQLGMSFMRVADTVAGPGGMNVEVAGSGVPQRSMHLLSRLHLPAGWSPQTSLGLGLRARSSAPSLTPDPAAPGLQLVLPGSAELNLSLERRFGPWTVNAFVRNVFDRDLYETQGPPGLIPLEPGRSFGLTASWKGRGLER